ncbi:zinc finger protein 831 isoform X2 [Boleophthalmus pectinirostris]|uniref:zinc finger protein 831 isoform X2 n=1 Tax=Boleophthalmus pectinirostris TaxID=150288 RepID=UPI00242F1589|nr:zinc finger protein 831 isoform X2 [Boleophthalmus pectinirostris]
METGKPELASAAHMSSVVAQTERRMEIQAPLTAVYIHTVPALPSHPLPQPPLAVADPSALHLTMPPLYSKETLPFLTLHIASGLQPGLSVTASPPAAKPKSAGKHLCPHCGRDCMKPSVLEKHVRCHTGERPYPCTVCGVSFKTQSNLYKHKRTQAHARLSSESEHSTQGSMGSTDSLSRSTETTSLSVDERSDECIGAERDANLDTEKTPVVTQTLEINEKSLSSKGQEQAKLLQPGDKPTTERPPSSNRHVVLQRQEATLFSKQWGSSMSSSKSQSHESTDSGFSESSEHYPSPGSLLPDHSMDSLTETTAEHGEESANQKQEDKNAIKEQENTSLEERITKLISQNSAVVEDKHLENVRPRKTALSKQGSIDLPMPYTYKDSFHFDMRINKMSNTQRNRRPGLYNSVPTQQSSSVEHAPLTRSNSLPFSVNLLQPDQSSPTSSSYPQDYTTLFRRGSSGQINPTSFSMKSVNQQSSTHWPLVRQAAVDCNHATDALCKNSSVEEACTGSLSCQGEAGDICGDISSRKFRRKKAQKFAYNKWYMYGGGTFKKLYEMERGGENRVAKGTKPLPNPEVIQSLQKRLSAGHCETTVVSSPSLVRSATMHNLETYPANLQLIPSLSFNAQTHTQSHILASSTTQRMPLRRNLSLSVLPLSFLSLTPNLNIDNNKRSEASNLKNPCSVSQSQVNVPSDRKKQKTDEKLCPRGMETEQSLPQPQLNKINIQPNSTQVPLFPTNTISINALPVTNSPATSGTTAAQNSFMPKYQLKLPNSQESDSSSTIQVGSKLTQNHTASVSTSASTVTTTESKKSDTLIWTHQNITSNCSSLLSQSMPCTASHMNVISPLVHQCPMADTKTTCSLRNSNAGLFSTTIQSSPFGAIVPTTTKNSPVSFTPIHRTQSSPAAFTAFVPTQQHEAPQKNSPLSLQPQSALNPDTNTPVVPCQLVPGEQTVPNVFHVQTPDLQICFQIISDEQLALIEPQIEKETGSKHVPTEQMHAVTEGVKTSTTVESTDKQTSHSHHLSNKEVDTLSKDSAKPSICDKSEKERPAVHMSQPIGQPPALSTHPHICSQVNKVAKDGKEEVSAVTPLKENILEISKITPKNLFCKVAAQDRHLSEAEKSRGELVSHTPHENNRRSATVTCTPISPVNSGERKCEENHTKFTNKDLCFRNSNETVTRTNLQLSMVSLSLSQTNQISDKMGLSDGPALAHEAEFKQNTSVTPVSTEDAKAAAANVPDLSTGLEEGGSAVRCVEPQSHTGTPELQQPEQSQEPPQADREGFTYSQLDSQVQEATARVDSFPNGWLSGQQCLQHLSQTQSGICGCPPQSPGTVPNLQSSSVTANTDFCNLPPTSLVKTNSYVQHMGIVSVLSQPNKAPQNKTVLEVGLQEAGQFQQQDQRQDSGADNAMINSTTHMITAYMSQSHTNEPRESYLPNSSVYVQTSRQANTAFSEHLCQDKPPLPCDKFPLLFGMGHSFSYPPADTLSGAVRVVQSSMEAEDSSSDDEGKLIIEL